MKILATEITQALDEISLEAGPSWCALAIGGARTGSNVWPIGEPAAPKLVADYFNNRAATIYGGSNEVQRNILAKPSWAQRRENQPPPNIICETGNFNARNCAGGTGKSNPKIVVDPPRWLRFIIRRIADKVTNPAKRARRCARASPTREIRCPAYC